MDTLIPYIVDWLAPKQNYLKLFADADSRVEGWFKGELIVLFAQLKRQGVIDAFEREAKVILPQYDKPKRIDFRIRVGAVNHLCEVKAPCISQSAGTPRNLQFYFRDDKVGFYQDFKKLNTVANSWVLGFIYPTPHVKGWGQVSSLSGELQSWRLMTKLEDFPEWLFIALWRNLHTENDSTTG